MRLTRHGPPTAGRGTQPPPDLSGELATCIMNLEKLPTLLEESGTCGGKRVVTTGAASAGAWGR